MGAQYFRPFPPMETATVLQKSVCEADPVAAIAD
jgi:hypothetical protein